MALIPVDQAVSLIIARAPAPVSQACALFDAEGRVLAGAVTAVRDQPPFDASAMDGYALVPPSEERASFTVIGESQAGRRFSGRVGPGQAVRIFTGAAMPAGATAVVIQEDVGREGDTIRVAAQAWKPGAHIRRRGSDFQAGDVLLNAGDRLDAWRLSLAAAAGQGIVQVAKRPRIAILATGNELVTPGGTVSEDQIFESNAVALGGLVRAWGGEACFDGICRDDLASLVKRLETMQADLIVTIGGASVGDHDLVKPALRRLDYQSDFDKVAVRPGKPTSFGYLPDGRCVLGLPGNPASAMVCAQLFLKPFIDAALGARPKAMQSLPSATDLPANGERETWLRARIDDDAAGRAVLTPFPDQDSSLIRVFAESTALIRRPVRAPAVKAGEHLPFLALDRL